MDFEVYKRIIDEVADWGPIPSITLSYEGESILNPKINAYLKYLGIQKIRPWISTRELSDDEGVLKCLLQFCSSISVSMDENVDHSQKNHNTDAFLNKLKKRFFNLTKLAQKDYPETSLSVSMILHPPQDIESLLVKNFIAEWIDYVHEIYLWQKIDFTNGLKYHYRNGIEGHLRRRRVCDQPFSYLAVLSDGRISPCCNTSRVIQRSINVSNGLLNAINSEEYQKYLERHRSLDLRDTPCEDCELWLDSWLGDEMLNISLGDGRQCQVFCEGSSYRIEGKL